MSMKEKTRLTQLFTAWNSPVSGERVKMSFCCVPRHAPQIYGITKESGQQADAKINLNVTSHSWGGRTIIKRSLCDLNRHEKKWAYLQTGSVDFKHIKWISNYHGFNWINALSVKRQFWTKSSGGTWQSWNLSFCTSLSDTVSSKTPLLQFSVQKSVWFHLKWAWKIGEFQKWPGRYIIVVCCSEHDVFRRLQLPSRANWRFGDGKSE